MTEPSLEVIATEAKSETLKSAIREHGRKAFDLLGRDDKEEFKDIYEDLKWNH